MNRTDEIDLPADWEDDSAPDPTSKRRGRVALIALLVALALVIAVGVVVGGYLNSLRTSANQITTVEITRGASDGERPEEIDANRARRAADRAKEAMLQKRSIQEYRVAQYNLARAMSRLQVHSDFERK